MGNLAGMLVERGHRISGSDSVFYPPMSSMLEELDIELYKGYRSENIRHPDLVIIGNSVSRGNPEVEYILNNRIPNISMADALYRFFLRDKEVISVSGTHGKSTTAGLLAHILAEAGEDPSFFVGGYLNNYGSGYRLGSGRFFVIEGDEYDSSFFQKLPKFICYRPDHLVLTSLEFDHADIYRDLEEIKTWFRRLVNIVPSRGNIIYSSRYGDLAGVTEGSLSRLFSYGSEASDFYSEQVGQDRTHSRLDFRGEGRAPVPLKSALFGEFNRDNITAAVSAALLLGVKSDDAARGVETFTGIGRRQEIIYDREGQVIIEDFAHHPTSIKCILESVRERFPEHTLWAIYEPRSATSCRNVLQDLLPGAFKIAHKVLIKTPYRSDRIKEEERLDTGKLLFRLNEEGVDADLLPEVSLIVKMAAEGISRENKNVFVVMSNGSFDDIYRIMKEEFEIKLTK
jgi:UDP-N-acetylmuramate: L-alanyl-gamma-D-glutamyl-meso-diaminopimelate ligase